MSIGIVLWCLVISSMMIQDGFLYIIYYFHFIKGALSCHNKNSLNYNKLNNCRLVEGIHMRCKKSIIWKFRECMTIDDMMVKYKDKYCCIKKYLPSKPIKWGIKIWCMINVRCKLMSNFKVYCRKRKVVHSEEFIGLNCLKKREA